MSQNEAEKHKDAHKTERILNTGEEIHKVEEDQREILLRMDRILKYWIYWNSSENENYYRKTIAQYVTSKARRGPQTGVPKEIADFVLRTKVQEDTGQNKTEPNIVACLVKDTQAYLASNYSVETESGGLEEGWGNEAKRSQLKEQILEEFEGLLLDVHFVEPVGQGYVEDRVDAHRECHAEMQLLKLSIVYAELKNANIGISKAPCLFCYAELWRRSENLSFREGEKDLEADSTTRITNWVPPQMIELKVDGQEESTRPPVEEDIAGLKESTQESFDTLENMLGVKGNPNWNKGQAKGDLKVAMRDCSEEKCQELREGNWDHVVGFPGVDEAIEQEKRFIKNFKNLSISFGRKMFEEFQRLKKIADKREREAFLLRAESEAHRQDLIERLEALKEKLDRERDEEEPNVPRHNILTLGNSLYVKDSEDAFKLFMTLGRKVLGKGHWKVEEIRLMFKNNNS